MNPGTSTARFMALWVLWTAPVSIAWAVLQALLHEQAAAGNPKFFLLGYPLFLAAAVAAGLIQSRLMARHRTRPRGWVLAVALGSVAGMYLATVSAMRVWHIVGPTRSTLLASWMYSLVWGTTYSVCAGTAQGLCVWGFRRTRAWLPWIAGIVLLRVAPALAFSAVPGQGLPVLLTSTLLEAAILMAGTAWLLDRLHFRAPPPAEREAA